MTRKIVVVKPDWQKAYVEKSKAVPVVKDGTTTLKYIHPETKALITEISYPEGVIPEP